MLRNYVVSLFLLAMPPLAAQTDGNLMSAGYAAPAPIELSPGQVVTLFFRGVKPAPNGFPRDARALSLPLPEVLGGLSVTILQSSQPGPMRVPILAVRQENECEEVGGRPVCLLTAVRVQVPVELTPGVAKLVLDEDGQSTRTFLVRPVRDQAHILTSCDLTWDTNPGAECPRLAFHADGTPVSAAAPARRGETIVLYAHGLGPTQTRAVTGHGTPATGIPLHDGVVRQLHAGFTMLRNAPPALPRYLDATAPAGENALVYAGLTPRQVGLYQINVRVPGTLAVPLLCGGGDTRSNAVIKVTTTLGTENVAVCVAP